MANDACVITVLVGRVLGGNRGENKRGYYGRIMSFRKFLFLSLLPARGPTYLRYSYRIIQLPCYCGEKLKPEYFAKVYLGGRG